MLIMLFELRFHGNISLEIKFFGFREWIKSNTADTVFKGAFMSICQYSFCYLASIKNLGIKSAVLSAFCPFCI